VTTNNETTAAAERVRRMNNGEDLRTIYDCRLAVDAVPNGQRDMVTLAQAYLAQQPTYADLARELAEAKAECTRLNRLAGELIGGEIAWMEMTREQQAAIVAQQEQHVRYADPTPLTPEAVMELLPATHDVGTKHEVGLYTSKAGTVSWYRYSQVFNGEFSLWINNDAVSLADFTVGRFRHLLAALAIAAPGKIQ